MKISSAAFVMASTFLSMAAATAADQPEPGTAGGAQASTSQPARGALIGFGSGTGMGPGGVAGSASSIGGGFGSPASGSGSQTFGGGFNQQTPGSGPFSSNPALNPAIRSGGAGGAGGAL